MYRTKLRTRVFAIFLSIIASFSSSSVFAAHNEYYYFYDPADEDQCSDSGYDSKPNGSDITWIGDSYSVGAAGIISQKFSGIDLSLVQDSKFVASGTNDNPSGLLILENLISSKKLNSYLVFALGTNGGWNEESAADFLKLLNKTNAKAVVVTSRIPDNNYAESNKILRDLSKNQNIYLADWTDAYREEFFESDSIHPSANGGYNDWVDIIYNALPGGGPTAVSTSYNVNYAGAQVWSDAELEMIAENQPVYEKVATKYNIPWQILAVVHSAETGLSRVNPSNGQGLYQLYSYTSGGTNSNRFAPTSGPVSEDEFTRQTELAAEQLLSYGIDLNSDDGVKRLFFTYNGTAEVYKQKAIKMGFSAEEAANGEGSAYVMNRYDAQRDPLSSSMSSEWPGRYVSDGNYDETSVSYNFGTFVKYSALGGATNSLCFAHSNDITATALAISWPDHNVHAKNDPKPEYIDAMKAVGNYVVPCNSSGCAPKGASCDIFVSTVMKYSGADPDFPQYGPANQMNYMLSHPEKYTEVQHNNDVNNLQSGDILVTDGHIFLYIVLEDGTPGQASASFNDRTGEHYGIMYFQDTSSSGTRYYRAFRRIN